MSSSLFLINYFFYLKIENKSWTSKLEYPIGDPSWCQYEARVDSEDQNPIICFVLDVLFCCFADKMIFNAIISFV